MSNHLKAGVAGAAVAALAACLVTGCGSGSSSSTVPKSQADVTVCKILNEVLAGTANLQKLTGSVLESNAAISHQLRQDLASFVALAATAGSSAAKQAEAKAKLDCQSVTGS